MKRDVQIITTYDFSKKVPSLAPYEDFNVTEDVAALRNAFHFSGLESTVISILTRRSYPQTHEILKTYKSHGSVSFWVDLARELQHYM